MHLLQSRPISALPVRPADQLEGLGWEKDVAHYPELVTPFGWSLFEPASDAAVRAMCRDFGLMLAGLDQVSIGGEVYVRPVPPFGSPEPQGSAPPALAMGLVARVVPALRVRMKAAKRALTSGLPAERLATWDERWRGEFEQRTQALLAEDLASLDEAGLVDHLERGRTLLNDGHHVHFQLLMPYTLALHELVRLCESLLGWDETDTLRLLVGSSPASVAGARSLDALRDRVAARPELVDALRDAAADPVAALHAVDPDVADELDAWLNAHALAPDELRARFARGHRTTRRGNPAAPPRRRPPGRRRSRPGRSRGAGAPGRGRPWSVRGRARTGTAGLPRPRRERRAHRQRPVRHPAPLGSRGRSPPRRNAVGSHASTTPSSVPRPSWPTHFKAARKSWNPSSRVDVASRHGPEPIPVRPSSASSTNCQTFASSPRTDGA